MAPAQIRAPRPPSRAHAAVCRPATRGPRTVHQAAHALRGAAPSGENAGCGFCADGGRFGGGGHAEPPVPAASSFAPRRALARIRLRMCALGLRHVGARADRVHPAGLAEGVSAVPAPVEKSASRADAALRRSCIRTRASTHRGPPAQRVWAASGRKKSRRANSKGGPLHVSTKSINRAFRLAHVPGRAVFWYACWCRRSESSHAALGRAQTVWMELSSRRVRDLGFVLIATSRTNAASCGFENGKRKYMHQGAYAR